MSRKKVIAANWKMYKTPEETVQFVDAFVPQVNGHDRDEIVICPPSIDLAVLFEALRDSNISVGGQDVFWEDGEGAYTGELSAHLLKSVGCTHVIIGHSERRNYMGETDDIVNRKLETALEADLTPIVCVGEVIEEREAGLTEDVLRRQCQNAFRGISGKKAAKMIIAYEPVWAIGTGKTATPKIAADAHEVIRHEVSKAFGDEYASQLRILYGGSVKPENVKSLMAEEEIDGALVGGASLKPNSFAAIVKY